MPKTLEALFPILADESFLGIIVLNEVTEQCTYINKLACQLLEIDPETAAKDFNLDVMIPELPHPEYKTFSRRLIRTSSFHQEVVVSKSNRIPMIASIGFRKVDLDNETYTIIMFEDVTYEKKLQRDLQAKQDEITKAYEEALIHNRQLKELDLAKDRFIALTTHELRTPLSAMVATADVLVHELYDGEEMLREYIGIIHEQGQHMVTLVNDILDFAKIQAGKMEYFVEHLDVIEVVSASVREFEKMAEGKGLALNYTAPDGAILAYFDKLRATQVVSNVMSNAIKYNVEGGKIDVWTTLTEDNCVRIHIRDTGPGIPDDKLESVFNEFETVGAVDNHHKGTGLGLPIARKLMNEIGGQIKVESTLGQGSTFTIDIPTDKVLDEELYRRRPELADDLVA